MRNLRKLGAFRSLALNEVGDKLLREYSVSGKVIVVRLESIERLGKRGGKSLELRLLFLGKMEEVEIVRPPSFLVRIDLVLYTVETCHKNSRIAEVRVAGRVRVSELKAALLGTLRICRNTDNRRAVRGRISNGNGGFEAGNKALE